MRSLLRICIENVSEELERSCCARSGMMRGPPQGGGRWGPPTGRGGGWGRGGRWGGGGAPPFPGDPWAGRGMGPPRGGFPDGPGAELRASKMKSCNTNTRYGFSSAGLMRLRPCSSASLLI